jgi:hypothetical protein
MSVLAYARRVAVAVVELMPPTLADRDSWGVLDARRRRRRDNIKLLTKTALGVLVLLFLGARLWAALVPPAMHRAPTMDVDAAALRLKRRASRAAAAAAGDSLAQPCALVDTLTPHGGLTPAYTGVAGEVVPYVDVGAVNATLMTLRLREAHEKIRFLTLKMFEPTPANPCIALYHLPEGGFVTLINPVFLRSGDVDATSTATTSSYIFDDERDVRRVRPASVRIAYMVAGGARGYVPAPTPLLVVGHAVHVFMEGYDLMYATSTALPSTSVATADDHHIA